MGNIMIELITLLLLQGSVTVVSQGSPVNIQAVLDQYCKLHPTDEGCHEKKVASVEQRLPPITIPPIHQTEIPSSECPTNTRKCNKMSLLCVPNDIDCELIARGIMCEVPKGLGVTVQTVICGSNGRVGVSCDIDLDNRVEFLTEILVQCQHDSDVDKYITNKVKDIAKFGILDGPGAEGGAGMYRCSQHRTWQPLYGSPLLRKLTESCYYAGCGKLPMPTDVQGADRPWSWVRGIKKDDKLICTATLIGPGVALTAAHCVTRSQTSTTAIDVNINRMQIDIPHGIKTLNALIKDIKINPTYVPGTSLQNDLALVMYDGNSLSRVPYACVVGKLPTVNPPGVVFENQNNGFWKDGPARIESSCPLNNQCTENRRPTANEFCSVHNDIILERGSSGGPYLAKVGTGFSEAMAVIGVLSKEVSCGETRAVYSRVIPHARWIKDCAFNKNCR